MKKILNRYNITLGTIIVMHIFVILYWGNKKEGYHIDEVYSYGLANSYYAPFMDSNNDYWDNWHDANYLLDYVSVSTEHTFAYDSVYYNQTQDVHPFLYYTLLHTVCSLFPDTFSKWYAIGINIVFSVLTVIVLYSLARRTLDRNRWEAVILTGVYALSAGAISNAIYLRMYVLLTFWTLLYTFLHVCMYEKKDKRFLLSIMLVTGMGGLTQYYFYIFAFFISVFYVIYLLLRRKWKDLLQYCASMICSLGINVLIYPSTLEHIFNGYRGTEAVDNLAKSNLIEQTTSFFSYVNMELLGGKLKWMILGMTLICLMSVFKKYISIEQLGIHVVVDRVFRMTKKKYMILALFGSVIGYFVIVSKISTIVANRYIFPIYPLIVLCVFTGLHFVWKETEVKEGFYLAILVLFWSWITVSEYQNHYVDYVYAGYEETQDTIAQYHDKDVLYIADYLFPVYRDKMFLETAERFIPITHMDFSQKLHTLELKNEEDGIVVYVYKEHEADSVFEELQQQLNYNHFEFVAETYQSMVYYCY